MRRIIPAANNKKGRESPASINDFLSHRPSPFRRLLEKVSCLFQCRNIRVSLRTVEKARISTALWAFASLRDQSIVDCRARLKASSTLASVRYVVNVTPLVVNPQLANGNGYCAWLKAQKDPSHQG
jgi:hypothetical protein